MLDGVGGGDGRAAAGVDGAGLLVGRRRPAAGGRRPGTAGQRRGRVPGGAVGGREGRARVGRACSTARGVRALRAAAPDVVLLVGGTDGGDEKVLLHNASRLARRVAVPIVLAGNAARAARGAGVAGRPARWCRRPTCCRTSASWPRPGPRGDPRGVPVPRDRRQGPVPRAARSAGWSARSRRTRCCPACPGWPASWTEERRGAGGGRRRRDDGRLLRGVHSGRRRSARSRCRPTAARSRATSGMRVSAPGVVAEARGRTPDRPGGRCRREPTAARGRRLHTGHADETGVDLRWPGWPACWRSAATSGMVDGQLGPRGAGVLVLSGGVFRHARTWRRSAEACEAPRPGPARRPGPVDREGRLGPAGLLAQAGHQTTADALLATWPASRPSCALCKAWSRPRNLEGQRDGAQRQTDHRSTPPPERSGRLGSAEADGAGPAAGAASSAGSRPAAIAIARSHSGSAE